MGSPHCHHTLNVVSNGTIFLLGSSIEEQFVLDEVLVVGGILEYTPKYSDFLTLNSKRLEFTKTEIFEYTNFEYIRHHNNVYWGKNYDNSNNFFSFFPCKINNSTFERPVLPDYFFGTSGKLTQNSKTISENNAQNQNMEYWQKLVNYLIGEGYYLSLYADEPDYYKDIIDARNGFKRF